MKHSIAHSYLRDDLCMDFRPTSLYSLCLADAPAGMSPNKESGKQLHAEQQASLESGRHDLPCTQRVSCKSSSHEEAPTEPRSIDFSRLRNHFPLVSFTSPHLPSQIRQRQTMHVGSHVASRKSPLRCYVDPELSFRQSSLRPDGRSRLIDSAHWRPGFI